MTRHIPALLAALAIVPIAPASGQTCTEPHYRWSEKIDTSFAHQTPTDVDVSGMLAWTPRTITAKDKCAKRIGREKKVYAVTAYVRRIKLRESDGDWHIEITEEESTPVPASCVIVEIPAPQPIIGHWSLIIRKLRSSMAITEDDSRSQAREPARTLQFVARRAMGASSHLRGQAAGRPVRQRTSFERVEHHV